MIKRCVKKPFFVVVAVIIVLVIGGVSITKMQTDLLPEMEMPYMMVITTEPGASPEKVENDVTEPIERALGVVSGVENITSVSAENYSMVMLEFSSDTDMNSTVVRISQALDRLELPEECGKPNTMEVSMDMMATMYASVSYKGKDIKELTAFSEKIVQPYLERQEGVASIDVSGAVEDTIEVKLNKNKIDKINNKLLEKANDKLAEASNQIDTAKEKLQTAKDELAAGKDTLKEKQESTNKQLADAQMKLDEAKAVKVAYESSLSSLKASKAALEAEKKAYNDAKVKDNYDKLNDLLAQLNKNYGNIAKQAGIAIPTDIEDAISDADKLDKFASWISQMGYEKQAEMLTVDNLQQLYNAVVVRLPQIDTELANLSTEITAAQAIVDSMKEQMGNIDENYVKAAEGGYMAIAGFGSADAQLASGEEQITTAQEDLEKAQEELENSRKAALENANIDSLLSLDTLSQLIYAQNFSMPAGYIDDKKDNQWLVKVGENYTKVEQLEDMVLTKIKGIGKVKLSDVADITTVDNAGASYAKVNGEEGLLLSIFKTSTASTSTVSNNLKDSFEELSDEYEGLSITSLMDQGDYIDMIIHSILTSILLGAVLAIIVLALFLKDVRPTIVVAFSIPFSVLFAIIIMYFTGITLNALSLAGLCLGIGMLVDNSIVVMENIYRLRNKGIAAPRAAVQGAKQVAGPIIASTVTTICVFLPMVYTTGMIADMLIPFAFTISYALFASLIVALTVVPTMSSAILKKTHKKKHGIFDKVRNLYVVALRFCLRFKIVPLALAIVLLVICVIQTFRTGLVMMDSMDSNQISVTLSMSEDTDKETAYKTADEVMARITKIDGVKQVGAMDGNASATSGMVGSSGDDYDTFLFNIIAEDDITSTQEFRKLREEIEEKTKDIACEEIVVSSSAMGDISSMMNSGLQVNIYGEDQQQLIAISKDIMKMMEKIKGCDNITNGIEDEDKQIHLVIDKNKVAAKGLTVAQIYQQLSSRITTEKTAITMKLNNTDVDVNIVDENNVLNYENLMNAKITATTRDEKGTEVKKTYRLSDFATKEIQDSLTQIHRENQSTYMSVTAEVGEDYNATLLSRDLQDMIDNYKVPDGYTIEVAGESEQVMDMVMELLQAIALGFLLIYLVMVAQFQSLLSPFIIIFTVPLAFTGGMLGLMIFGQQISAMALMGFMILMGTVVNNGIVFVDYANKLRLGGMEKREALVATGKTRMRPILMTALTTILSMSVMMFSNDAGNAMQKSMAIVVAMGLIYSTLMTLFIVPVMYDILYRRTPKNIDVGDDLDDVPDEVEDYYLENE